jgi:hypothetical protein
MTPPSVTRDISETKGSDLMRHRPQKSEIIIAIATFAALAFNANAALAQNHPLSCWYNEHAGYAGSDNAPAAASIGKIEKTGKKGDHAYSYTISAKDGASCPIELPLGAKTATTVALVRKDDANCTNDKVSGDDPAAINGSVTIARRSNGTTDVFVHLAGGVAPNTAYGFYLKCVRKLGSVRTDANGKGNGSFDFLPGVAGSTFAFDMYPEGAPLGDRFQSLQVTLN